MVPVGRLTMVRSFPKSELVRAMSFVASPSLIGPMLGPVAIGGSFVTRLGIGGMPFLLPLLYQIGMGFTPVQAALLILPQPIAAMSLKVFVTRILRHFGYRRVLLWNTVAIGPGWPLWHIIAQGFAFGFCASLQYSSMNTLAYADVQARDASMGSTIASNLQQMSMSFGVVTASLVTALFIPDRCHRDPAQRNRWARPNKAADRGAPRATWLHRGPPAHPDPPDARRHHRPIRAAAGCR